MKVYRVGEGRSPSGKVLDKDTKWVYTYEAALEISKKTKQKVYVSVGKSKYKIVQS